MQLAAPRWPSRCRRCGAPRPVSRMTVSIRAWSPLARCRPGRRLEAAVVGPADDQVPGGGFRYRRRSNDGPSSTRPRWIRSSRIRPGSVRGSGPGPRPSAGRYARSGRWRRTRGRPGRWRGRAGRRGSGPARSYSSSAAASPVRSRRRGGAFPGGVDGQVRRAGRSPSRSASSVMAPPPSTAASCSWSRPGPACTGSAPAYSVIAARWVMEIIDPSSARISDLGGISGRARSRRAAGWYWPRRGCRLRGARWWRSGCRCADHRSASQFGAWRPGRGSCRCRPGR